MDFSFGQHDAEIFVVGDFVIRGLGGIMLLNSFLDRKPAGGAFVVEGVEVVKLDRIGQRNDLDVGLLEQGADVGAALAAATDDGHVDLLAGSNELGPSQHVARNEREPGRDRGGLGQEPAATLPCGGAGRSLGLFRTEVSVVRRANVSFSFFIPTRIESIAAIPKWLRQDRRSVKSDFSDVFPF